MRIFFSENTENQQTACTNEKKQDLRGKYNILSFGNAVWSNDADPKLIGTGRFFGRF